MRNKKNRENTRQRKTITRTRQYLRGSTICLCPRSCKDFTIIGEKYKVRLQCFTLSLKMTTTMKTLITKNSFYILCIGFTMGYKMGKKIFLLAWACQPKPPFHGLSLRKSPIKKPHNIIQVGSGRQPDQT